MTFVIPAHRVLQRTGPSPSPSGPAPDVGFLPISFPVASSAHGFRRVFLREQRPVRVPLSCPNRLARMQPLWDPEFTQREGGSRALVNIRARGLGAAFSCLWRVEAFLLIRCCSVDGSCGPNHRPHCGGPLHHSLIKDPLLPIKQLFLSFLFF